MRKQIYRQKNQNKITAKQSASHFEFLESRCLMSASDIIVNPLLTVTKSAATSTTVTGYTPAQIKAAYGISSISLSGVTGDGSGQTIAIVDAYSDPNIASDLAVFDKQFSLSAPASFKQVSVTGSTTSLPASDASWDGEIALDVEWAHAIAPKANIVLVDATSDSIKNLMAAVKYASSISTVSVVSMSWGASEYSGETAYDSYFTTPAGHIGITYVAASGDEGASGGAEYPAISPNVLSVGGTTLSISSSGSVSSESAWSDSSGGTSVYEKASTAQAAALGTTYAKSPVVSYDANPNTGFAVYDSVADDGYSGWEEVGGTSAGAPQWAALVAIADQARVASGSSTLDGATGTLPAIYSIYSNATSYAADFSDITSGSSSLGGGGRGGFGGPGGGWRGRFGGPSRSSSVTATTGYDTLTGVGTPKAAALISALATAKVTAATKSKPTATAAATVKKAVKRADVVAAIEADRSNVATSSPMHSIATYSEAALVNAPAIITSPVAALTSLTAGADPDIAPTIFAANPPHEAASPLLFNTVAMSSSKTSIEQIIHHTDSIIAGGAPTPLLANWTNINAAAAIALEPISTAAGIRHSTAAAITAAAIVVDGAMLAVYYIRKRRGPGGGADGGAGGLAKSPFSNKAVVA